MKKELFKKRLINKHEKKWWGKSPLARFSSIVGKFCRQSGAILLLSFAAACGQLSHLPSNIETQVNIKDSTVLHFIDSLIIHEATRYKDMAWLGDSLKIEGQRSRMWAYADTTKETLLGGLEEDKVEEKTRIVYKTKWKERDSIRVVEKPYPVEVEKIVYKTPKFWRVTGVLGIILTGLLLIFLFLKLKSKIPL